MGWEEPLSTLLEWSQDRTSRVTRYRADFIVQEHVRLMTESHPDAQEGGSGISVLNIGYGLGIVSLPLLVS